MNCYNQLLLIQNNINDNGGFSYNKLNELKDNNELDDLLNTFNIDSLLRDELTRFISIIENTNYIYHEYLRKIHIHESEFIKIFNGFGYILGLYFDNIDSYRDFPVFFKECVNHYNITNYSNMSLQEIECLLGKYVDLKKYYNIDKKRELNEVVYKISELYTTYSKHDSKLYDKKQAINCLDKEEFFVYSEYEAYARELHNISRYNLNNANDYVKWVARYNGDGYGYDVLSYDITKNREKLIEVKSGLSDNFQLTRIEYKTMMDTVNKQYSDYYIYRYYYDINTNLITLSVLKYNKKENNLIDINTNEIYRIAPYFEFDENGFQKVKADIIKEDKYNELIKRK